MWLADISKDMASKEERKIHFTEIDRCYSKKKAKTTTTTIWLQYPKRIDWCGGCGIEDSKLSVRIKIAFVHLMWRKVDTNTINHPKSNLEFIPPPLSCHSTSRHTNPHPLASPIDNGPLDLCDSSCWYMVYYNWRIDVYDISNMNTFEQL